MKSGTVFFLILLMISFLQPINAQNTVQQFNIETERVAYILGGAGITGAYQHGSWTYSIEAFGVLTVPESMHGNEGFDTALKGIELQVERFLTGTDGFFIGPEIGISNLEVTHKSTGNSKTNTGRGARRLSPGTRG